MQFKKVKQVKKIPEMVIIQISKDLEKANYQKSPINLNVFLSLAYSSNSVFFS